MTEQINTPETEEISGGIMSLNDTVDDIFNDDKGDEELETVTQPESEKGVTEAKAEEPEPEKGEEVETPATKDSGLQAALIAERKKRQEAEKRLKEIESKPLPDPITDPEGYAEGLKGQVNQDSMTTRIALSRDLMIDTKPDYLEKESVFMGLITDKDGNITDTTLHQKFLAAPNPARFAYNHAIEHQEVQKLKDPAYIEQIKREAYEAGLKDAKKPKSARELPDLTNATASGKNSIPVIKEPTLDSIMEDSPF
jgi:hypothetical protein